MTTNLTKDEAEAGQLTAIYRARRAVEIQFRAWKQSLNPGKALKRKSGEHPMQAWVSAAMIAHQLGMKIATRIGRVTGRAWGSYQNLYALPATYLVIAWRFRDVLDFNPDERYVTRGKRRRDSPVESGIRSLG